MLYVHRRPIHIHYLEQQLRGALTLLGEDTMALRTYGSDTLNGAYYGFSFFCELSFGRLQTHLTRAVHTTRHDRTKGTRHYCKYGRTKPSCEVFDEIATKPNNVDVSPAWRVHGMLPGVLNFKPIAVLCRNK